MPPKNCASWITAPRTLPFQVDDAPYKSPGPNQVVIKNGAVAINQYDWVLPFIGPTIAGHLKYPFIFGSDVAGTVVEIGPGVTRFRVGDRVFGMAVGIAKDANDAAEGGFQLYPVLREHMIAPTPPHISDEQACVLGLALGTAAYGLFHRDYLALDMPDVPPPHPVGTERPRAVLIAGGASSVGSNAIQLCVSAGYEVITTCSPKNFAHVKKLGAVQAFDYHSPTLTQDLAAALEGRDLAGSYAMGGGTVDVFAAVIRQREKDSSQRTSKAIAVASPRNSEPRALQSGMGRSRLMANMVRFMMASAVRRIFTGVDAQFILVDEMIDPKGVIARLYTDFLPRALAEGQYLPTPEPLVAGTGLEQIPHALEVQMEGVSAQKVVVKL